jgi:hypothetical protein
MAKILAMTRKELWKSMEDYNVNSVKFKPQPKADSFLSDSVKIMMLLS